MKQGYIKLFRSLQDNELWEKKPFGSGQAWVDLLMLTNFEPGSIWVRGIPIAIARGECGWSQVKLAERWGWSRGKVRRFLKYLKTEQQIEHRTVQQNNYLTSVIIITNYEDYQGNGTADDTAEQTADGQQTDSKRYSKKKNKKNKKNKKEEYIVDFEKIWQLYPSKQGRKAAERHFTATVKTAEDEKAIHTALDNYLKHVQTERARGFGKQYQNGGTWFNNWTDWVEFEEPGDPSSLEPNNPKRGGACV